MNDRDHAVVVGITGYPALGDLDAPVRDAKAIRAWLVDPKGGGLKGKNVALIRSKVSSRRSKASSRSRRPYQAQPNHGRVQRAFEKILDRAGQEGALDEQGYFGRRLYIYMAGHGLSFPLNEGALYTANATRDVQNHVVATGWFASFVGRKLFREYVLWLDFCMDQKIGLLPQSTPVPQAALGSPAPYACFLGFACPPNLRTVETEIKQDRDRVHGVFTWTILQGLKGAARRDPGEAITGESLFEHLMHSMKDYLKPEHKTNLMISRVPNIPTWDPDIVFVPAQSTNGGAGAPELLYPVRFTFPPDAKRKTAKIWSGSPPAAQELKVAGGNPEVEMEAGLHLVEVPGSGLRQGFEVTGSGPVVVTVDEPDELGDAVREPRPGATFELRVEPGDETSEIVIVDSAFGRYAATRGNAFWQRDVPFGLYKIQAKVGALLNEHILLLDRDEPPIDLQAPAVPSPAPLQGSAFVHEYHEAAIHDLSRKSPDVTAGQGAQIFIMARVWSPEGSSPGSEPWSGVKLLNEEGRVIVDLARDGDRNTYGDPAGSCLVAVSPGTYYLSERLASGRQIEQSLIACEGWRLEAYVLRSNESEGAGVPTTRRVSLLMNRIGSERREDFERLLESARLGLADERGILSDRLKELFMVKFDNPIAGLLGAHLLLVEAEKAEEGKGPDLSMLNTVVPVLRQMLGKHHSDVEVISMHCPDLSLHAKRRLVAPPMFSRSWRLASEVSRQRPSFVPLSVAQRVGLLYELDPYLVWWSDGTSRRAYKKQLMSWRDAQKDEAQRSRLVRSLPRERTAVPSMAPRYLRQPDKEALAGGGPTRQAKLQAARMQIPAAKLKEIWQS